jgi:peptidoglycan-N-acetylglucosamine deacetylase
VAGAGEKVHLTFDDGPDPLWTPRILQALRDSGCRATFFVVGPAARRSPHLIREMVRDGHGVELHCSRHVLHTRSTRSGTLADTREALADLRALGVRPALWRTPWGVRAPWTAGLAEALGLRLVGWTADTHDWRGDSTDEMFAAVAPLLRAGATVLMHDGLGPGARRRGCGQTVALVPRIVREARNLGLEPAPLGEPYGFAEEQEASA